MFVIKADNEVIYNPALFDEQYQVINPELTLEVNKAGSLTFTMPPCNAMWGSLDKLTSIITVEQDGVEIFRGRVMNDETDTWKQRSVYVEGELAFLLDSIQRPYEFSGNAVDLFRQLITNHNESVNAEKRFSIGRITAVDETTEAAIDASGHSDTFTEINDRLLNAYGGYIRIWHGEGTSFIDYLSKAGNDNTQPIQLGVNLLDLKESISAEDVFTVLIPTGAMQNGDDGRFSDLLKISEVNNGLDYLEDAAGIAKYGRIWKRKHWDNITEPEHLKEIGQKYLQTGIAEDATLTIEAIDLHFVDPAKQRIGIGDMVQILSDPHGLDRVTICYKIVMPLQEPEKTVYTFGEPKRTLTDNVVMVEEAAGVGGGGGGGRTTEEEVQDVLRWAYAQADQENARYNILTGEIDNVEGRTSAAEIRLDGVEAEVKLRAKQQELDELSGEMETLETNVTVSADGLREIIQKNDKTITELKATIDGLEHWVTDADGNVAELTNTVRGLESKVETADGKVSILTNTADGLTNTIFGQGGELAQLKTRADEISTGVKDTQGNVGSLITKSDSVTAKIANVDGRVSQLAVTADGLNYTLTKQGQELSSLKALIDEISLTVRDTNGAMGQFVVKSDSITGKLEDANGKLTALQELTDDRFSTVIGDIKVVEGEIASVTGSALWQTRNAITGVVGNMTYDENGNVYIKEGGGLRIFKGGVAYGVYDENNLTAGLMVQKLNDGSTSAKIKADVINLEGYVKATTLEANYAKISDLSSVQANITNLTSGLTVASVLSANMVNGTQGRFTYLHGDAINLGDNNLVCYTMEFAGRSGKYFGTGGGLNLAHSHAVTVNDDGTITLGEVSAEGGNFKIADTKAYKDGVSAAYGNGYNVGYGDGKDAYLPTAINRTGYSTADKTVTVRALNSHQDLLTGQVIDAVEIYNAGWNECRAAMTRINNLYTISQNAPGTLYMLVNGNYTSVGTDWVKVTSYSSAYRRPAEIA